MKLFKVRMWWVRMNNPYVFEGEHGLPGKGALTNQDFINAEYSFQYDNNITDEEYNDMYIYNFAVDTYFRINNNGYDKRYFKRFDSRSVYI